MSRKVSLPVLLSVNGGFVDSAGFLALQGLFSSHVTGNFVTLGASVVLGTSGVGAKVMALPLFCVVVALVRVLGYALGPQVRSPMRVLMWLIFALLLAAAVIMTGNVTQAMIDVVDLLRGLPPQDPARRRLAGMAANILGFAIGCAAAALLFVWLNMWCFMVPPLLALLAVMLTPAGARA
jgi:uncharacterized membrane protein YoaK (UPF0700 family)